MENEELTILPVLDWELVAIHGAELVAITIHHPKGVGDQPQPVVQTPHLAMTAPQLRNLGRSLVEAAALIESGTAPRPRNHGH